MECTLCQLPVVKGPLFEEERPFCCPGCLSVWRILDAKKELEKARGHPLVLEAARLGLISNPHLIEELNQQREGHALRFTFEVGDLFCPSCQDLIEWVLKRERGIKNARVDYATDVAIVEYFPSHISKGEILKLVTSLGYRAHSFDEPKARENRLSSLLRLGISAFFALNVMMFSYPLLITLFDTEGGDWGSLFAWLSLIFSIPVATYGGWPIYKRALYGSLKGFFGMEFLATLAIICAFSLSVWNLCHGSLHVYFDALTALVALLLFGRFLEQRGKFRTKEALVELHRSLPKRGRRVTSGQIEYVPLKEVSVGDQIRVLQGERVPLDGVVVEGEALVDESMLTGEVMPIQKGVGQTITSGTIISYGWVAFSVTSSEKRSTLAEMVGQIESVLEAKARYRRSFDPIVTAFIPLLMLLGLSLLLLLPNGEGLYRLLTLLLIACPCAIGVAAPLAESGLMKALLERGVIVRNRGALHYLGGEDLYIFDKTGTITEGHLSPLTPIETWDDRAILKSLCTFSNHPIAVSIAKKLFEVESAPLTTIQEHIGRGIEGAFGDRRYYLGSRRWFLELNLGPLPVEEEHVEVLFYSGTVRSILLRDTLKSGVEDLVKNLGVDCWLLSGDRASVVENMGSDLGFSKAFGSKSPLEKQQLVNEVRNSGKVVAMVGDGINDAPALSGATLSFAPLTGADLSLHTSDFLLSGPSLTALIEARRLGNLGRRIVQQNLFWASIYNGVGILLAITGLLHPLYSTFAMTISSIIVLLNSRRVK